MKNFLSERQREYYVSYNYNFADKQKTFEILRRLGAAEYKLLYGVNYCGNNCIFDSTVKEIKDIYKKYVSGALNFESSESIAHIPDIIRKVMVCYGFRGALLMNDSELWKYISVLDGDSAFRYIYLVSLLYKIFRSNGILSYDKIRFCGERDISFSVSHNICGMPDSRNLYIWFEIDFEKELPILSHGNLELLIADIACKSDIVDNRKAFDSYLYSVSIVEYNNFNLVIGGYELQDTVRDKLSDICSEEEQFVRYRPELKKFL